MTPDFESDAHDYLLDQMEPARRSAFEQRLQTDPSARAAFKQYADSLAGFACETAAPEPLAAADQKAVLAALVATAGNRAASAPIPPRAGRGWFWPMAAIVLVVLNLFDFRRPVAPAPDLQPAAPERKETAVIETPRATKQGSDAAAPTTETKPLAIAPDAARPKQTAEAPAAEVERLRDQVAELQQARDRLRAEFDLVVRRLGAQAALNRDLSRLTTMELVDAASYARGERKGLVTVARGILTEPGIVVPEPTPRPPTDLSQTAPKPPYAWSVYDEKENRGFVNLYDLPPVPAESALHIWVRPADAEIFQRVGEVPRQLYGGSGSIQYALPSGTATPAEILITIEPRTIIPALPAGPTVLKGP